MYPTIDEPEIYEAYSHRGFAIPEALPNYGTPQPSAPPYNSITMRGPVTTQRWSTGLFHCVDDPAICLVTCCCPWITFGLIAEIVNEGYPTCTSSGATYGVLALTGFACLYSCFTRSRLRAQYNLPEEPCVDCLVHFCCEACALCQEYRELKNQGFDLSIGWEANMERQRRGVTVAPAISPGMTR